MLSVPHAVFLTFLRTLAWRPVACGALLAAGAALPSRLVGAQVVPPPPALPPASPLPTPEQLIDRHVVASGGREAILRVSTITDLATMEVPALGLKAEAQIYAALPNRSAMRATIAGIGEILAGTDGDHAWQANPMQGPRALTGPERLQAIEDADFRASMLFPREAYRSWETMALVDFAGEPAYKVRMVRQASGREVIRYFSQGTGLVIGSETVTESELGTVRTTVSFHDFQPVNGVIFAMRTESNAGANRVMIRIREKRLNAPIDSAFLVPDAVKPLLKR